MPITIGVVDDHPAISAGVLAELRPVIRLAPESRHAKTVAGLLEPGDSFDVVILDIALNDGTTAAANVEKLVGLGIGVVIYTVERRPALLSRCLESGALALLNKSEPPATLAEAAQRVAAGEPYLNSDWALVVEWMAAGGAPHLSPREIEILTLFASGLPMKSVARRCDIEEGTVSEHLKRIRLKYTEAGRPAATKTELYFRAVEDGHLPLPTDQHRHGDT